MFSAPVDSPQPKPQNVGALRAQVSRRLGRYALDGVLGEGAMGRVYLASDPKLDRQVAIKVMAQDYATLPGAVERFEREARAIAKLRHPNIVEIFDHAESEREGLYLVMERLVGLNLLEVVEQHGAVTEGVAASLMSEVCRALEHAHGWGVIHRDLKPANIIAEMNGRVVLTDFGLVKAFAAKNPLHVAPWESTRVMGTPGFMAPEQMLGATLGPAADLFALGVLYYNLLTAHMPFLSQSPIELVKLMQRGAYPDPREYVREISPVSVDLIRACLQAKPQDRPASAGAVRDRLQLVLRECQLIDPRDVVARYLREPRTEARSIRQRQVAHLRDRLKSEAADRDPRVRRAILKRIAHLEHKTRAPARLCRERRADQLRAKKQRRWTLIVGAMTALAAGVGLGLLVDILR
ncbi:MAG: serine/threonine protein kinase [Deltaproteobacteria bacterium]|nr:serine/threonine protein kinase [Deltaproteobacteria bacterium]